MVESGGLENVISQSTTVFSDEKIVRDWINHNFILCLSFEKKKRYPCSRFSKSRTGKPINWVKLTNNAYNKRQLWSMIEFDKTAYKPYWIAVFHLICGVVWIWRKYPFLLWKKFQNRGFWMSNSYNSGFLFWKSSKSASLSPACGCAALKQSWGNPAEIGVVDILLKWTTEWSD